MKGPDMAAELLKTLRTRWLSPYQIAREMGIEPCTALKWARGLAEQGLLVSRPNPRFTHLTGSKLAASMEYTVAPAWRAA